MVDSDRARILLSFLPSSPPWVPCFDQHIPLQLPFPSPSPPPLNQYLIIHRSINWRMEWKILDLNPTKIFFFCFAELEEWNERYTFKLVNGIFDNSFTASAAHPDFELHSLIKQKDETRFKHGLERFWFDVGPTLNWYSFKILMFSRVRNIWESRLSIIFL